MNDLDVSTLAYRAMGNTEEETDVILDGDYDIDNDLFTKYRVDFEIYTSIVSDLLNFTPTVAGMRGKSYNCFVDEKQRLMIVKREVVKC